MNPDAVPFPPPASTVSKPSTSTVSEPSTTSLWTSSNQAILLQTARAIVYNPTAPEKYRYVRIVFYSGSLRSYVREQVAKGLSLTSEDENMWYTVPPWLGRGEVRNSTVDEESQNPEECLSELKKEQQLVIGLLTTGTESRLSQKKFGSFERLIVTTSLVLRLLLDKVRATSDSEDSYDPRAEAEHQWILECQKMVTSDRKFEQWSRQLDLFQDNKGVWRCRGRIQNMIQPNILYCFTGITPLPFW